MEQNFASGISQQHDNSQLVKTMIFSLNAYYTMDSLDRIRTRPKAAAGYILCKCRISVQMESVPVVWVTRRMDISGTSVRFCCRAHGSDTCVREWWRHCIQKSAGHIGRSPEGGDDMAESPCLIGDELS
jgi:hypothetical protein